MDSRLQITDPPRPDVWDGLADLPLVSIAWRTLRAEHQRRAEDRRRLHQVLTRIINEAHRLRTLARSAPSAPEELKEERWRQESRSVADVLEEAIAELGIRVLTPVGEQFTAELMDLFENVAPLPDPRINSPHIAEVILPAVLWKGDLIQMGKAVIAVPMAAQADR